MSDKMIITHERYTLTLRHEFVGPDGHPHHLKEPISVSYVVPHTDEGSLPSSAIVINDMMERMRMYMIKKGGEDE